MQYSRAPDPRPYRRVPVICTGCSFPRLIATALQPCRESTRLLKISVNIFQPWIVVLPSTKHTRRIKCSAAPSPPTTQTSLSRSLSLFAVSPLRIKACCHAVWKLTTLRFCVAESVSGISTCALAHKDVRCTRWCSWFSHYALSR
jgi:hypothetical protein